MHHQHCRVPTIQEVFDLTYIALKQQIKCFTQRQIFIISYFTESTTDTFLSDELTG